jgi:hypothetical protein
LLLLFIILHEASVYIPSSNRIMAAAESEKQREGEREIETER